MNCEKCKKTIPNESRFCPKCGRRTAKDHLGTSEALASRAAKKFSFGAFSFGWIYFAAAGAVKQSIIAFLATAIFAAAQIYSLTKNQSLVATGSILSLSFALYLGSIGRIVSADSHRWKDIRHFQKNQFLWDLFGIIFFCFTITITVLIAIYGSKLLKFAEVL